MQKYLKQSVRYFILLMLGEIVGTILLVLVYLLPTECMRDNAAESLEIFLNEGPSHLIFPNISATRIDNYSDSVMINTAIYDDNENILVKAMAAKSIVIQQEQLSMLLFGIYPVKMDMRLNPMPDTGMAIWLY